MTGRIIFISEALSAPFDEGIKNVAFSVHSHLKIKTDVLMVTKAGNNTANLDILKIGLNKLFLNNKLRKLIKNYSPDVILYFPEASLTFNSFVRAKVLKYMNRSTKIVILGAIPVEYSSLNRRIIRNYLRPDLLLLLGKFDEDFFLRHGLRFRILPPAVDNVKFCQATEEEKKRIRSKFNISINKTVVLHVGHVRTTRNVQCLSQIQKIDGIQVVIVGSTSTPTDGYLKDRLMREGVRVIDEFIPDIAKMYKMSDIYVFPVFNKIASIIMPLSVLEAMACNLPIITTRFGALEDNFKEDVGFRYFDRPEELVKLVKGIDRAEIHNNKKIESFTWDKFTNELIGACEEL